MLSRALLAGLTVFAGAAHAGEPRSLTAVRSAHYHVRTDLDRREAEEITRHMDRVFEEYERRFASFPARQGGTLPLYLFRTREAYVEHVAAAGHDASNTAGAFYLGPGGDGLATYIDGQSREMLYHTLQHEGFHQFAWVRLGKDLPGWLNEGLAEYFGEAQLVGRRFRLGCADEARLARLRRAAAARQLVPLDELASLREDEWAARTAGAAGVALYDQAWSVVHFLIEGEDGRHADAFVEYLRAYAAELPPYPSLARAMGAEDCAALEAAWKRHLDSLEPDPVSAATTRLSFLGRGLQTLHEAGVTPHSMNELREALRERRYTARRITHAGYIDYSAEDAAMFQTPASEPGGPPGEWELVASRSARMPPSLRATVAGTEISIRWSYLGARGLVYRVEHK